MKILVFGASGFIGKRVFEALSSVYEVYSGDRTSNGEEKSLVVDLLDRDSVVELLEKVRPEVIINCAGSVENSEKALSINPIITLNIIQAIVFTKLSVKKVITSGSAGEYGIVASEGPVSEETPLMGTTFYARSKVLESSVALALSEAYGVPLVVARIFNPIGIGMHPRFLLPNLIKQVGEVKTGQRKSIELSRLDAKRDYINVLDIAAAIKLLVENDCPNRVYNIGSGNPISNKQLVEGIFSELGVSMKGLSLVETSDSPEPNYAVHANISKMIGDFGWKPKYSISETIKQVADSLTTQETLNDAK